VHVGDVTRLLGPGDAYYFESRRLHRFRNAGDEVCEVVSACTPPSF
jgi:mannose-6-phosphate isomerase-like protein (cupin superfamily)